MDGSTLRKKYIDYFAGKNHKALPSDSLIPSSDPTLLFTSAGMVQFKKYFAKAPDTFKSATTCQKCFRTSDLDEIGYTPRHLSFFEMLGNFSFGGYFKKEAIEFAWDFLTKEIKLDKSKLYITVYKDDDEAVEIWKKHVSDDRIYRLGEKTNFWNMGPTGPCGPCSEIIYDLGKDLGCGKKDCDPGCDCVRWLEIWNLVFTQFDRQEGGKLVPLPQKNIDTGMGLERLACVSAGKKTVFDTDLFLPIIKELESGIEHKYGSDSKTDTAFRVISDHTRASAFLVAEGIFPANEGRGYVLRRIIRRAVRQGKLLGIGKPFLYRLTGTAVEIMKEAYPELPAQRENIAIMVKTEEEKFLETLDTGTNILNGIISRAKKDKLVSIPGKEVFSLYDTYGFPPELTKEILLENKLGYDEKEYGRAHEAAQQTAKKSWKGGGMPDSTVYRKYSPVKFLGYEKSGIDTVIKGIIKNGKESDILKEKEEGEIILDATPFYPESGGQVGDKGRILLDESNIAVVLDTQKPMEDVIIHKVRIEKGELALDDEVKAVIDIKLRKATARHHTSTHLLHKALHETVGSHATQSGSLVAPERFRFDYVNFKALTENEKEKIEELVNEMIMRCHPVNTIETTYKKAKELGSTALFGEKYGDKVRCVIVGGQIVRNASDEFALTEPPESIELCGGTHCGNTGEIGIFRILKESSIGSNLRRIEAVCGESAREYMKQNDAMISALSAKLKSEPQEIAAKIDKLLESQRTMEGRIRELEEKLLTGDGTSNVMVEAVKHLQLVIQLVENTPVGTLRSLADKLGSNHREKSIITVINTTEDKVNFVVSISRDAIEEKKLDAGIIAKKLAQLFEGSAGGRNDFAQGGGKKTKPFGEKDIIFTVSSLI